jgi:hypothetical protein
VITFHGKKVTATEAARLIVAEAIMDGTDAWPERDQTAWDAMTKKERASVDGALDKVVAQIWPRFADVWKKMQDKPEVDLSPWE